MSRVAAFDVRRVVKQMVLTAMAAATVWRVLGATNSIGQGDLEPLGRIGLQALVPTVLGALIMVMPPGRSAEGVLMRVAACVQLLVIVLLPRFALPVALGFPIVFLVVEVFETQAPRTLRTFVERCLVRTR